MKKNRVALLIGAGAVENAWAPVLNAIKEFCGIDTTADGANFVLANWIYMLRFYSTVGHIKAPEILEIHKKDTYWLKKAIVDNLKMAQDKDEIRARPALKRIIEKLIISDDNTFGFVTTNWDTTVDKVISQELKRFGISHPQSIFHIHGDVDDCNSLYLPSEITDETFRAKEESFKIGLKHKMGMEFFMEATHIILYGISLDPLDAELSQMLRSACNKENLKEVTIINLENEKQRISERVRLLFFPSNREIKINFIDPNSI
ncbi:MAG: hypothetical protein BGO88_17040 [Flavobacterium sp. 38-13]|jgi:hypothetical protein|uniref:hypothetical protein n=1 Tax=Flavobacterium sp. 38-13 TaxID=1896168 RepID=UPI0009615D54|nr:hypothetical protein [Flavobacterium sp. 38-13]OJX52257.1 MAG: hypothetical protein BGO88_17040 [Flavobacterium sp. 38-13]